MGETQESTVRKFVIKTPGKLILTGEHAVVYGKLALAASVDLTTEFFLTLHTHRQRSSSISVFLEDLKFDWSLPLTELPVSCVKTTPEMDVELLERLQLLITDKVPSETSHTVQMALVALCFLYCSVVGSSQMGFEIRVKSTIPIGGMVGTTCEFINHYN
jgi:mevalonate kinase